jgi:outer membrane protein assembly factor BamB
LKAVWLSLALAFFVGRLDAETFPMEAGNLMRQNAGSSPSSLQAPVHANWTAMGLYGVGDNPVSGPVVLPNQVLQAFSQGLASFDRTTGNLQWTYPLDMYNAPTYDPATNLIYVGGLSGEVVVLDTSGAKVWSKIPPTVYSASYAAPLVADGRIIASDGAGSLAAYDQTTYAQLWKFPIQGMRAPCTPAYDGGQIYLVDHGGTLYRLDAATGKAVWTVPANDPQTGGILLTSQYFYLQTYAGDVKCFRRSDGSKVWDYQCLSFSNSNLATCGKYLIVSNDDRCIRALDLLTGQLIWKSCFAGNFARCAPIVICGKIFVSGCVGDYYGLDGANGNTLWTFHYGSSSVPAFVDWATADGHLYVADTADRLYDFVADNPGDPAQCACNLGITPTETPTVTPTFTVTATFTSSPSSSATPTVSPTFTVSPTITLTATPTPSPTATPTASPSFTQTPFCTPTDSPTLTPTEDPTPGPCNPEIRKLVVVANPSQSADDRMVSLWLGDCGADRVKICAYTVSMVEVVCWEDSSIHVQKGQWVHEQFKKAGVDLHLAPGTYYVKVWVYKGANVTTAITTFVVLP